jgi:DNA-binding transcriptional LysR family regulator
MLDVRQLQTLVAVARTGSYTAAAEALAYTQPAVSYQMRQLQREAGTLLVVQAGRNIKLTQAGQALVMHAETVFAAMHAAQEELAMLAARSNAVVRITAFQSSCATLIPLLIGQMGHDEPGLQIALRAAEPAEARAMVRRGEADIGLLASWDNEPMPDGEESMRRIPLITDRRCVVIPGDHPLAARTEIDFADLASEQWVMESFRDRFTAACATAGFRPRIAATADDQMTIQTLVAAGQGITLMNELSLRAYTDARLAARPLRNWPLRVTYALLWPDMASVPAVATVLSAIEAIAREMQGSPLSPQSRPATVSRSRPAASRSARTGSQR